MKMKNRVRIIQTFWSGGASPLVKSCGWTHPEYNLMSWALSCCSLREHYDQVELYTDQRGYEVLIDKLHLPYTDVHVVYDDSLCLPQHWAYAKIKTYSMQTEPFLHVDGDIYISRPFEEDVLEAGLVVQNEEIGTAYYRNMLDAILRIPGVWLPDYVRSVLGDELLPSYNMGVFGGSDLRFIHDYCDEAKRFLEKNRLNDSGNPCSRVDCNVFFEQMLFAIYAKTVGKDIARVIKRAVADNGYTRRDFCDVAKFHEKGFFHILGGHKRVKNIYRRVADVLLAFYPDYYHRAVDIAGALPFAFVLRRGVLYDEFLSERIREWETLDKKLLADTEEATAKGLLAFFASDSGGEDSRVSLPPGFSLFSVALSSEEEKKYLRRHFKCEENFPLDRIAVSPSLLYPGFNEFPLIEEDEQIASCLRRNGGTMSVRELQDEAIARRCCKDREAKLRVRDYVLEEITYMVKARILIAQER